MNTEAIPNSHTSTKLFHHQRLFNSFSAKGNIELFANNTDSGESARSELSHLKSALFGCEFIKLFQKSYNMKIESSEFEHGRVYFKQFGAERVKGVCKIMQIQVRQLMTSCLS